MVQLSQKWQCSDPRAADLQRLERRPASDEHEGAVPLYPLDSLQDTAAALGLDLDSSAVADAAAASEVDSPCGKP